MQRWDGAMPPKQKFRAPTKSRTSARWHSSLLFLAIMTPPSRCLTNSSQHGGPRAPICACIRYLTRCAAMRDSKSSWHKMQGQATSAAICPECGTRLEGGFSRGLGRCMICLLRVGFDDAEEPDETLFAAVTDRLGNYRIEHHDDGTAWELGHGAMGVTYRAIDTSLQRPVALKLIASEWVKRGAEARERFMREARAAAALRHPNVATVYHFGIREENGQCFCAMELVEGETLETRVRRTGPLDALTTIEIALQVSSALAAAEKQGLVHRDLKPANLMLVAADSEADASNSRQSEIRGIVVKVIDFGVAKALAEKPDVMGLTHGGFVGTPAFASPEQFTDAPVDVRSDIYSLGATLWYLLTGNRPFQGTTIEQIRASQRSRVLPL